MAGPLLVVIAGSITTWIAYTHADPLVTEDYYRKGLQAGHTIASSERASALGLQARLRYADEHIQIAMAAQAAFVPPPALRVTLSHPTRAGLDQRAILPLQGGRYAGSLRVPQSGHWLVLIEDDLQTWRLLGKAVFPLDGEISITAIE